MRQLLLFTLLGSWYLPAQDLSVFESFTDHAVLQREVPHPIWGEARPGRRVRIAVDGEEVRTRTDREGRWRALLPAMPAGGPHTLSITDGRSSIALEELYFGDVYLLSGQSNMEWRLVQSDPDSVRARQIADPAIRQIKVSRSAADVPRSQLPVNEAWKPGVASEIADFSGVGAYFAHYLRDGGVDVPIGLLHSSWGGSRIEAWLPAEYLADEDVTAAEDMQTRWERQRAAVLELYASEFGGDPPAEDPGPETEWMTDGSDAMGWATATLPGLWESAGYENVDGVFYYRRTFDLDATAAGADATLYLGPIDDGDQTYVNGRLVGETPNDYSRPREYSVPADALREGENVITVRVTDFGGGGGFHGQPEALRLVTAVQAIPLAGAWDYRIGSFILRPTQPHHTPTLLYNAMIAPLEDLPLTGVLWYQGESNAGAEDAPNYAEQMRSLIAAWRNQFASPELPFYWVQLANFMPGPAGPDEPGWAVLRAQQTAALDVPHTAQAVITDIGEAGDIHPKNKWEVGRRLALHALKNIYNKDVVAASPRAVSAEPTAEGVRIGFDQVGKGLRLRLAEGERYPIVRSLTVQDGTGEWHWAVGTVDESGQYLWVINPLGGKIRKVRYAWFNNPDDANLFTAGGLPVTPFELGVD